jgi:hypothetical protein
MGEMKTALILALLVVASVSPSQDKKQDRASRTCLANRQTLANATQAAKVTRRLADYRHLMGPCTVEKLPDLLSLPICMKGGRYSTVPVKKGSYKSYKIRCSVHGDFEPGTYPK